MLRLALAWMLCALLAGAAHAQAPAGVTAPPQQAWPAPPAAWYGAPQGPVYVSARDYELWQIDRELMRLREARPRMFWPVALTAVGGGMTLGGALAMVVVSTSATLRTAVTRASRWWGPLRRTRVPSISNSTR